MWTVCLIALCGSVLFFSWRLGPEQALGRTVALSLFVPVWVDRDVLGFPVNVRIAAAIAAVSAYCLHPASKVRTRLGLADFAGLALIACHLVSDSLAGGFGVGVVARAYGEWFLPYVAGRLAHRDAEEARRLAPTVAAVGGALAAAAVFEAFARVNPFEVVFGPRPPEGTPRDLARWGMKRAFGPTLHPIYFGVLLMLLAPWALEVAGRLHRRGRWLAAAAAPVLVTAGVAATGSRGPALGLLVLYFVAAFVCLPRRRPWLAGAAAVALLIPVAFPRATLDALHFWSGERTSDAGSVELGGGEIPNTGTANRLVLYEVYGTAMRRAGLLGFGTEAVSGFPVNVPLGWEDVGLVAGQARFVDNAYILLILRFGYVGAGAFLSLMAFSTITWWRFAVRPDGRAALLCAGMAGAAVGVAAVLLTVWMPHDFGFVALWEAGAAAGMTAGGGRR